MDNKNTNSAGYNKDENYTGRTVSRKKEKSNSSHDAGHDRRQDHSRSGGHTSENHKQDHSHSKNHGQNYSNMDRGKNEGQSYNKDHGNHGYHGERTSENHGQSMRRESKPHSASDTGHPMANAHRRQSKSSESGLKRTAEGRTERTGKISHKSKKYTILLSILAFVIVLGIVVAALWHIVDSYEPSVDLGPAGETGEGTVDAALESDYMGEPPAAVSTSIERKSGFYTMLVVGHDQVAVNTDVIMLVSFDVANGSLSVMQIPRDTYIEYKGTSHKINSAYGIMRDNSLSDKDARIASGMDGLADLLEDGLGIPVDFWAIVDLDGFSGIVDAVGGVEMDLTYDMDYEDPDQDLYIHLKKGVQTLNGDQAEQFVRFRYGYAQGDIGRVDAQKVFMSALFRQLKSNLSISNVAKIAEQTIAMVNTDMKLLDCVYFGKNFVKGVDPANITFVTLPGESTREYGTSGLSYYVMRRSDMLALVNKYFNPYTIDLTEQYIDPKLIFNSEDNRYISSIYLADPNEALDENVYSADDINSGAMDIPLVN